MVTASPASLLRVASPPPEEVNVVFKAAGDGDIGRLRGLLPTNAELLPLYLQLRDKYSWTMLHMAALKNQDRMLDYLLTIGALPDMVDNQGDAALHVAAEKEYVTCVDVLLRNNASKDLKGSGGQTALMKAAQRGSEQAVRALLDEGADPLIRDNSGHTALDMVCRFSCMTSPEPIQTLLRAAMQARIPPPPPPAPKPHASASPPVQLVKDEADEVKPPGAEVEWERLKAQEEAVTCQAIDELMKMIGMRTVKIAVLDLYKKVIMDKKRPVEARTTATLNFLFTGNPGTGKTTVARLLAKVLHQLGLRTKDVCVEVNGVEAVRDGAAKFAKDVLPKAMDATLFLDEAYQLDPKSKSQKEGEGIMNEIIAQTENNRDHLTVIFAGYRDKLQDLLSFNSGLPSRFPFEVHFDDYDQAELKAIFVKEVKDKAWLLETDEVAVVASRRLARGAGRKGFGNGRDVRNLFLTAQRRANTRLYKQGGKHSTQALVTLTVTDVIGERPVPERSAAVRELDRMIGLSSVKQSVANLMRLAVSNYSRELRGQTVDDIPLNRLFLGNPGTGKTSVAMVYGRILKELGFLTKGDVVLKGASDLIGTVVGETQDKVNNLLAECAGKVLVIDEAYSLMKDPTYGTLAINTLVEKVQGRPGEDIAVLMLGYEKDILQMLNSSNEGLARRFQMESAFRFEDYNDDELRQLLVLRCKSQDLLLSDEAATEAVRVLAQQRSMRGFGNAGAVNNLVGKAMLRMASRLQPSEPRMLQPEDFGLGASADASQSALSKLTNVQHIIEQIDELKMLVEQYRLDGKDPEELHCHYVFTGNPGTGKTTVARMMADVLFNLELLPSNQLVEFSAQKLQAGYLGQTQGKVEEALTAARGGVLFVDEAHMLGANSQFAKEAYNALLQAITSTEYSGKLVIIFAGYEQPIHQMLQADSGMQGRFTGSIHFPDWDADAVVVLMVRLAQQETVPLVLTDAVKSVLVAGVDQLRVRPGWGNARDAMSLYKSMCNARYLRLAKSKGVQQGSSNTFEPSDANTAVQRMLLTRPAAAAPRVDSTEWFTEVGGGGGFTQPTFTAQQPRTMAQPQTSSERQTAHAANTEKVTAEGVEECKASASVPVDRAQQIEDKLDKLLQKIPRLEAKAAELEALKKQVQDAQAADNAKEVAELEEAVGKMETEIQTAEQQIAEELTEVIKEAKTELKNDPETLERLKGKVENAVKRQRTALVYRCGFCGRSDCNYMPTWTEVVVND